MPFASGYPEPQSDARYRKAEDTKFPPGAMTLTCGKQKRVERVKSISTNDEIKGMAVQLAL